MKILVAGFKQETNTFSPITCDLSYFKHSLYKEGQDLLDAHIGANNEMGGILKCIEEHGDEVVPAVMMRAQSNGRVAKDAADHFIKKVLMVYDRELPSAIFLVMHGGMAIDHGIDDGTGYIYNAIRQHVGPNIIITASHDMHSNITPENIRTVNAIAGLHTYPHVDQYMTGYRAACLGYRFIENKPTYFACVRVPMIVPAEGYSTEEGVFKDLVDSSLTRVKDREILDISIFQMQPWLNVKNAASSVTVAATSLEAAKQYAQEIAHKLFDIRKQMTVQLYALDDVIDKAIDNKEDMPVILVDSADSPAAGSCADSSAVLERLLERNVSINCAIYMNDAPAADKAFALGVGAVAEFELGGTLDPAFQKRIKVQARVHSLHDGTYRNEGPAFKGMAVDVGHTAVLRVGENIDVVVMKHMEYSYDPQAYRAFGVDPAIYDLVVVKSAKQYKAAYGKFSSLDYPTDTPGSSTANLVSLPFDKIPRPFYPFDDLQDFDDAAIHI